MRVRPFSLLSTAALAALWGCPLGTNPASLEGAPPSTADATTMRTGGGPANTAAHDDAADSKDDISWVQQAALQPGVSALRVLMTDAPIAADNVFVTFCGIQVASGDAASDAERSDDFERPEGADAGAPSSSEGSGDADDARSDRPKALLPEATDGSGGASGDTEVAVSNDAERPSSADAGAPESKPTVSGTESHEGWRVISDKCQTIDLLTLQDGVTEAVGINTLPPGSYGQIRLMLTEAAIVVAGERQPLVVPSGAESGVKIVGGFTVRDGQAVTITIDFDAASSIRYAPGTGFMMAPVIKVVEVTNHGETSDIGERAGGERAGEHGASTRDDDPNTTDRERGTEAAPGAGGSASDDGSAAKREPGTDEQSQHVDHEGDAHRRGGARDADDGADQEKSGDDAEGGSSGERESFP
jgi:uncharacterized protein DUF4382